MENRNHVIIVGLLALLIGLTLGYFLGTNAMPQRGFFGGAAMYDAMGPGMYGDELIDRDGAMMHAMDEMMLGFRGLEGAAYEEMFLRSMIVHHLGAIAMAEQLLEQTDRPELITLANNIIRSQSAEVQQMKGWLQTWFSE
jgi:uncharacterized protein (DUF305 family)